MGRRQRGLRRRTERSASSRLALGGARADVIDEAFQLANQTDPQAQLFYDDHEIEEAVA